MLALLADQVSSPGRADTPGTGGIGGGLATVGVMMTTKTLAVLTEVCSRTSLDALDAAPLHEHAAALYLSEAEGVVVRLNYDGEDRRRARTVVELTRRLTRRDFPSVTPAGVDQPFDVDGYTVRLWWAVSRGESTTGLTWDPREGSTSS